MEKEVLYKLSYGLFVLTAHEDGKDNGCISNTVIQTSSDPLTISVSVNKSNLTCDMIKKTNKFTVSVISEDASFDLFKRFGFVSGRDTDKFADYKECKRIRNGTMAVTEGINSYISAEVIQVVDLGSHMLFIAKPTDGEVLSNTPSATYAYYHENIKPGSDTAKQSENGKTVWKCKICGYEYVGEELPEDFVCPLCKHPADDFEKV